MSEEKINQGERILFDLGYKKYISDDCIMFKKDLFMITFIFDNKSVITEYEQGDYNFPTIRPFEISNLIIKAIYLIFEGKGWLDE